MVFKKYAYPVCEDGRFCEPGRAGIILINLQQLIDKVNQGECVLPYLKINVDAGYPEIGWM